MSLSSDSDCVIVNDTLQSVLITIMDDDSEFNSAINYDAI